MALYAIVFRKQARTDFTGRHGGGRDKVPGWIVDFLPEKSGISDVGLCGRKVAGHPNKGIRRGLELDAQTLEKIRYRKVRWDEASGAFADLPEYDGDGELLWQAPLLLNLPDEVLAEVAEVAHLLRISFENLSYDEQEAFVQWWQKEDAGTGRVLRKLQTAPPTFRDQLARIIEGMTDEQIREVS